VRYSRMNGGPRKKSGGGAKGAIVVVCLITAVALVYVIGAAKIGDFISEKIIVPVGAWFTGEEALIKPDDDSQSKSTPAPSAASSKGEKLEKEITFAEKMTYTLQIGVFTDQDNATTLSNETQAKGGAGFILEDDGDYRVLISGYGNEADAANVKERLLSEQDIDSKVYEIDCPESAVTFTAEEETIQLIERAALDIPKYQDELLALSIEFDKTEKTFDEVKGEIEVLGKRVSEGTDEFKSLASESGDKIVAKIYDYYSGMGKEIDALIECADNIALSSGIKHAFIKASLLYKDIGA
jgi:hypothetical protein